MSRRPLVAWLSAGSLMVLLAGCATAPAFENTASDPAVHPHSIVLIVGVYRYSPAPGVSPVHLENLVQQFDQNANFGQASNGDLYATLKLGQDALQRLWKGLSATGKVDVLSDTNVTTAPDSDVTLSSDQGNHEAYPDRVPAPGFSGYALSVEVSSLTDSSLMLDMDGHVTTRPVFSSSPVEWDTHNHGIVDLYHSALFVSAGGGIPHPIYYIVAITPILGN